MAGIYGVLEKSERLENKLHYKYFFSAQFPNIINEEYSYKEFVFGRSVINKLLNDRIIYEDNELIIVFEGIIYNKKSPNNADHIKEQYHKQGIDFVRDIDGLFSGFIYDKKIEVIYVFVDHLNTRPVYYYCDEDCFIFSSELKHVTAYLRSIGKRLSPEYNGIYSMLGFGSMLDDLTIVKNIKRIPYGSIFEFSVKEFKYNTKAFFSFKKNTNIKITKKEIIDRIDTLMVNNVIKHWGKDDEYGYNHYSSLSGGMDAKTQLLIAEEIGFKNITTLTFAQSGSADANISLDVAKRNKFDYIFGALDNGICLHKNIDEQVSATDGLILFSGSLHAYNFMRKINHNNFGVLHSGQIGDLVFGSYIKREYNAGRDLSNISHHGTVSLNIYDKINNWQDIVTRYSTPNSYELLGYEQRVINGTLFGDRAVYHLTDTSSVFYDRELIEFSLTLPDWIKLDERLYIEWLKKKHPDILTYKWDKCGTRPTSIMKIQTGNYLKRINNRIKRMFGKSYDSMNPYDLWFKQNRDILKNLHNLYEENIHIIHDKELKSDIENIYNNSSDIYMRNKFTAVTLLLTLKMHIGEVK